MVWHDYKTDPPKKSGRYILYYLYDDSFYEWESAYFDKARGKWVDLVYDVDYESSDTFWTEVAIPCKWAEVDLSEVE